MGSISAVWSALKGVECRSRGLVAGGDFVQVISAHHTRSCVTATSEASSVGTRTDPAARPPIVASMRKFRARPDSRSRPMAAIGPCRSMKMPPLAAVDPAVLGGPADFALRGRIAAQPHTVEPQRHDAMASAPDAAVELPVGQVGERRCRASMNPRTLRRFDRCALLSGRRPRTEYPVTRVRADAASDAIATSGFVGLRRMLGDSIEH